MLRSADLEYDLPESMIATRPIEPRDAARLCVVRRSGLPAQVEHACVRDLPAYLRAGDVLVLNTTSVLPAWLEGTRVGTGGRFTGLYLAPAPEAIARGACSAQGQAFAACWTVLLRGGHLKPGAVLEVTRAGVASLFLELVSRDESEPGAWHVGVYGSKTTAPSSLVDDLSLLASVGLTPIPPYIRQARKHAGELVADEQDRMRYQTVFADGATVHAGLGSVAAPTAGLHFTPSLLARLGEMRVATTNVVLHVGPGTFRPVETEFVEDHQIHAEWCSMGRCAMEAIRAARARGGRVICVGTTSARVVESFAERISAGEEPGGTPAPHEFPDNQEWLHTRILITPGYRWRWVDGLLTNFHLPRSTLMAMVAALLEGEAPAGGVARLKWLYAEAIRQGYRFYSYGDAMLVLPGE